MQMVCFLKKGDRYVYMLESGGNVWHVFIAKFPFCSLYFVDVVRFEIMLQFLF